MFYILHTIVSAQVPWSVAHAKAAQPFSNYCYLNVTLFVPPFKYYSVRALMVAPIQNNN